MSITGRGQLALSPRALLLGAIGGSLHITGLDGLPRGAAEAVRERRFNPSVDAFVGARIRLLSQLSLGASARVSLMASRQRYLVGDVPILDLPAWELDVSVSLAVSSDLDRF